MEKRNYSSKKCLEKNRPTRRKCKTINRICYYYNFPPVYTPSLFSFPFSLVSGTRPRLSIRRILHILCTIDIHYEKVGCEKILYSM